MKKVYSALLLLSVVVIVAFFFGKLRERFDQTFPKSAAVTVKGPFNQFCTNCSFDDATNKLSCKCKDAAGVDRDTTLNNINVATENVNSCNGKLLKEPCNTTCYGAKSGTCNTCDQVKAAYRSRNWRLNEGGIQQCKTYNN